MDPVVRTSPSNKQTPGPNTDRELRPYMYHVKNKKQNLKQKQYCNKFNKDFKKGPH